ncbi:hypothetical protein [Rhodobacter capsulatus]|uniref:Lipoprotein, putative n=1 Tax=Rhodobacter capsulatus (strain ATCC BAA-309 / NBRC 16581 / SB1003) TaxID=272942 RepID=D5APE7_RHOCB|nr:hypothetical protein [Rhodobacter capsulatus]ADE84519.1 lipoprotein, putative [Rhodobacter capsulatus SB 1003]ETD02920.1 hypothetical protein U714_04970 [Rhodobacter capsulatus DE442]ETD79076.1 hypothetical protein U717_04975 [Rhodobacter capsulatus R121]ETE54783.1 hypothetical protein U715_04965 [Rhodobacter capsulatus Y262]MDS0926265.1 hypothetical protein [Rhodobacter capsulatus]
MVGASKILTVSYGTFSCTLEGFDEPFTTMKAIAEYFRDLAAEDRYFGAEPPQPDAEMLHRIAEREMARRVDAKIEKNGVILRPGEAAAREPAPVVVAMPAGTPVAGTPAAPVAAAPIAAPPEVGGDPISESVAAKLQRIRSAVAQARAAQGPAEPDADPDLAPSAPVQTAPVQTAQIPEAEPVAAAVPEAETDPGTEAIAAPEDFGFALDISGPLRAEDLAAEEPGAEAPPAAVTQAALPDPALDSEDEEEDETPGSMDPEKIERMRRRAERRAARQVQAEAQGTAEDAAEPAAEAVSTPAAPETTAPETTAPEVAAAQAAVAPEAPRPVIRARVIKLRRAEPLAAAAPVPAPETAPATTPEAASVADPAAEDIDRMLASVSATMAEAAAPESPAAPEPAALSPEAEAELMAELAALTENLGDVDWGIEGWSTESAEAEVASAPVAPEAVPEPAPEPQLAAEAAPEPEVEIEALVVELDPEPEEEAAAASAVPEAPAAKKPEIDIDALFAEDTPAPAAFTVVTLPPDAPPPGVAERRTHPAEPLILPARPAAKVPPLPEGDLPRLLEKADAQMAGNENRRRISAIAHLKAAVAATVAERRAGTEEAQKDETAPYRQDLTQAVRPRRPVLPAVGESHHQTAARPEARPAPLVLVSEQRVDRAPAEAVAKAQAVRPRRIIAASLTQEPAPEATDDEIELPLSPEEASSFAEFAQSRAPQGLAELLEAAAAYTAQVEGRPHFSPPQIMSKVSAVGDASFSREDRLRMFGTLLRQGKIAKVKRGQYAITEASRFYQARA